MARSWLIDSRGLATKVKNATLPVKCQINDCGANRECPNCHHIIDNSDISHEWPGFPAGVKFEPSDPELLDHLAAKCGLGNVEPHKLIDVFIPTLDGDEGINYAHPENLPGAKKDGSSVYFFYRTVNAYATGQRKRRKIQTQNGLSFEQVRWHKTGKTKTVRENGIQKGCKKIMVLYRTCKGGSKSNKSNWVMHQYHLGSDEDEKQGGYVVSKIFYQQPKANDDCEACVKIEECDTIRTSPRTPKTVIPDPPRLGATETPPCGDKVVDSSVQEAGLGLDSCSPEACLKDEPDYTAWLAGESQAPDLNDIDKLLMCNEIIDSSTISGYLGQNGGSSSNNTNDVPEGVGGGGHSASGVTDLENLELDTPDFQLADLYFGSQDSVFSWLDRL